MLLVHRIATRQAVKHVPSSLRHNFLPVVRKKSTVSHFAALPTAPREVPTPLVLLSTSPWSGERLAEEQYSAFIKHFTLNGWNVTCVNLDPPEEDTKRSVKHVKDGPTILQRLEAELVAQLRQANNNGPFPPLLVANGLSTLVAEAYVSSNPLSGMALLNPPLSATTVHETHATHIPSALPAFTYEPRFPCLVAWSPEKVKDVAFWEVHRIEEQREEEAGESLDRYVWSFDNDDAHNDVEGLAPFELRKWAEENGIHDQQELQIQRSINLNQEQSETSSQVQEEQAKELPEWYTNGNYKRNPKTFKKEPLVLDPAHLEESFIRGSGPGGQAINKLSTAVQLKHTPTGYVIKCQKNRSRQDNREFARKQMSQALESYVFGKDSVLARAAKRKGRNKASIDRRNARRRRAKDALSEQAEGHEEEK